MIRALFTAFVVVFAMPAVASVDIQEVKTPGGLTAWLVEEPSIPFVAIEFRFPGGASLDAPGKRGATNLMMALIEEGTGDLDAQGFAAAREALAASYGFDAYDDAVSISARFLNENREEAVALLAQAIAAPSFDQSAIDRVRSQVVAVIEGDERDPNSIARRTFDEMAFGDHPYASAKEGTLDSIAGLTRDDLVAAHQAALTRDRVQIGVAGDISAEELGPLLDELLAGLPETGGALPEQASVTVEGGVTVVPYPTPQSVVLFGHDGIDRDDPDFFPAFIANQILGGAGLQSRLGEEIREKRGLTYGIGTFLADFDYADLILGQASTDNARMAETIELISAEWARIAQDGVTEDELMAAQTYLTGSYPLRFDGNGRIAGIMVGMQSAGLPIDYIATRNERVNAVTVEDIQRVASELFDAEGLRFVVVGEPDGLMPAN
ncbi:MAG: insulinase family protein [Rhodobacteraceae bacterium]|nr:insulinase family protein [Paracoccaceae bacterium]